jgi:hypothetical protein
MECDISDALPPTWDPRRRDLLSWIAASARTHSLLVALFGAIVACNDPPTVPPRAPRTQIAPPAISGVHLAGSLQPGGTITFAALAADETFRMPEASYYPMLVWTNRGESEQAHANSLSCFDAADRVHVCSSFQVRIDSAADPSAALAAATAADARIVRRDWWPDSATFYAFGDPESAMRSVRRRAGVAHVGYWYLDGIGIDPGTFSRYAEATLRFDAGTPTPNDGRFMASPGDSLFARVAQPGGGNVTYSFALWY